MELFIYRAEVTKVYDWDTATMNVDLWFKTWIFKEKFRFWGINTPEIRWGTLETKARWNEAKNFVIDRILWEKVIIKTFKDKTWKFWRYLAEIFYKNKDWKYINLNKELVSKGYATEYMKWKNNFTTYK